MTESPMVARFVFQQGERVRDRITGARGVVVGRLQYLFGCNRYAVQPYAGDDGKQVECFYVDEGQLETDHGDPERGTLDPVVAVAREQTGGWKPDPKR